MTQTPANINLTIYQGATFSEVFEFKDEAGDLIDLTGFSARMQARTSADAADTIFSLTSDPSAGLTINAAAGTVAFSISATSTAEMNFSTAVYDLELTAPGGAVDRVIQGQITLSKEVTR